MKTLIVIFFFAPWIILADIPLGSGDKQVDEVLGLRGTGTGEASRTASELAIYANVVYSKQQHLPDDLWRLTEDLIALDDRQIWEDINKHLFVLNPIEGVFDLSPEKDCVQLKLLAIAKIPRNPHVVPNDQVFDVVLWLPWLKEISWGGRTVAEVATFTGIEELKRQGAYPVPDPGGKPLDMELLKVTDAKFRAAVEKAEQSNQPLNVGHKLLNKSEKASTPITETSETLHFRRWIIISLLLCTTFLVIRLLRKAN